MNLLILILTIFGIIFSRDIYLLLKKFIKLVDERLLFLAGIIKKVFKYLLVTLRYIFSNIFNYLDKKFKLKKFLSLLERILKKIWNFDDYLKKQPTQFNNFGNSLFALLVTSLFLIIKLLKWSSWLALVIFLSFSPIVLIVYLVSNFTPKPIALFIEYVQYAILNTFGNNLFSVLIIFIVFAASFLIISSVIGFLFNRYFGTKEKIKNNRFKGKKKGRQKTP